MLQSMPLGEEIAKTKAAVELFRQMVDGDGFGQTFSSAIVWSQMLGASVSQALRYLGISPATLWQEGAWPYANSDDERTFLGEGTRSRSLLWVT